MPYAYVRLKSEKAAAGLWMIVDTGQTRALSLPSSVFPDGLEESGFRVLQPRARQWSMGIHSGQVVMIPEVHLDGHVARDVEAFVGKHTVKLQTPVGGLGVELLRRYVAVSLDLGRGRLELWRSPPEPVQGSISVPLVSLEHAEEDARAQESRRLANLHPLVHLWIGDEPCVGVVDTGYTGTLAIGRSSPAVRQFRPDGTDVSMWTHPDVKFPAGTVDRLRIGQVELNDVPAVTFDDRGLVELKAPTVLIGLKAFRGYRVITFDWQAGEFRLVPETPP